MLFCGNPISSSDEKFTPTPETGSSKNSGDINPDASNENSKEGDQSNSSSKGNSSSDSEESKSSSEDSSSSEESSNSSKSPLNADNGIENIGLAVFKWDKFIGELSPRETLCNLIISKELKSCRLSIADPDDSSKAIDMLLAEDTKPKIEVSILNGTPYVTVKVKMNSRISSITNISETITEERIAKIEESASRYLKDDILNYLYKTSKEFKSDISSIGRYAISNFKTYSEFLDYNWLEKYEDAFFSVEADVSVKSSFLLTGT